MKKQSIITFIFLLAATIFIASCGGGNTSGTNMKEDAEKYVKIKCENRIELNKFANDTTFSKSDLDSVRRIFNKDLKKIRNKYSSSDELLKQFEEEVKKALETVPECDGLVNQDGKGMQRK